jgi:hypothetical protein
VSLVRRAELKVLTHATERIVGRRLRVRGRVWPARPGETVRILGRLGSATVELARARVGVGGRVETAVKLPRDGLWRLILEAPGREGFDRTGRGAALPLQAFSRNPHKIPGSAAHYIVQDLSERLLYYYEAGALRRVFPVVFGKPSTPTPLGTYAVYAKGVGPRAAFGPLVLKYHRGYWIHGTDQEYLLRTDQRYYSHGCTRNFNDNILWLWPRVPIGTPVRNIA